MNKLIQTRLKTESQRGNCFATVIACFLDLNSPEDVIQIQEHFEGEWIELLLNWLSERGWDIGTLQGHQHDGSFYLVSGKTIRESSHVCIYQNGKLWHDPHPDQNGLIEEVNFQYLEFLK